MNLPTLYSLAANAEEYAPKVVDERGYSYVWSAVITGLSVVFLGLVILILFVWIMGKIFTAIQNKNKSDAPAETKSAEPVKTAAPVKTAQLVSGNDDEIIAVISAAVAAMGQAEGKIYKLKSVKAVKNKAARSPWAAAGLQSDTMPF